MIVEIFTYVVIVTLLAGLAALCVERLLAEIEWPRRFAWLGAYVVAVAVPLLSPLWATNAPAPVAATFAMASADAPTAYAQIDWNTTLAWLWAAATAVLLLLYAASWARLAWLARRWPPAQSGEASVLVADDVGPAVLGVLEPRVILPRWLMDAPAPLRSTVVAHELEHIAARDQAAIIAAQLVAILLPWNLPLWWFAKRLRAAIEIDCDARVLRKGVDPVHYADVLLTVGQHGTVSPYVAATLIEPVTHLERRIRIMLTQRPRSTARAATAAVLTAALAACATQIEPPVVTTGLAPPGAVAAAPPKITAEGFVRINVDPGTGVMTLDAPRIVMTLPDSEQNQSSAKLAPWDLSGTADRFSVDEENDTISLEGNVRFDLDRTLITASRAVGRKELDGSTTLQIDDAKVIRSSVDVTPSSE